MKDPKLIAAEFAIQGNILDVKPLGNGLINDTFRDVLFISIPLAQAAACCSARRQGPLGVLGKACRQGSLS